MLEDDIEYTVYTHIRKVPSLNVFFSIVNNYSIMLIENAILYLLFGQRLKYKFNHKYRFVSMLIPLSVMILRYHLSDMGLMESNSAVALGTVSVFISILITAMVFYADSIAIKTLWTIVFLLILSLSDSLAILIFSLTGLTADDIIQSDSLYFASSLISKIIAFIILGIMEMLKKRSLIFPRFARTEIVCIVLINLFLLVFSVQMFQSPELTVDKNIILNSLFLFSFLISAITLIIIFKLSKKAEEDLEKRLSLQQLEMENKLNSDMTNVVETLRSLRHDMNNHIVVLKNLLDTQQYDILHEYIDDLCEEISPANDFVITKNKALSALIYNKSINAKMKHIEFEKLISVDYIDIPDKDLCSLVGNLLDNAIEACEKVPDNKYMELAMYIRDNNYCIECNNTFKEAPVIANNTLVSTKKSKGLHGIGFKNMKAIVSKYFGTLEYSYYDLFKVKITLPVNKK